MTDLFRRYNFIQAFFKSFYSKDLYRDVALNWGGMSILYLLSVLTIGWLIISIGVWLLIDVTYHSKMMDAKSDFLLMAKQFPDMSIKNGEVHTPENKPYFIKYPRNQRLVAIIDTSDQYHVPPEYKDYVRITKDSMIFVTDKKLETRKFSPDTNIEIHPVFAPKAAEWIFKFIQWGWLLLVPIFLIISFIYRLLQALLYAALGKIIASILDIQLKYLQIFQLALVSITPTIVISTLCSLANISFAYQFVVYFVLGMGYLTFAISTNRIKDLP